VSPIRTRKQPLVGGVHDEATGLVDETGLLADLDGGNPVLKESSGAELEINRSAAPPICVFRPSRAARPGDRAQPLQDRAQLFRAS
jgi:hypothetical protein